MYKFDRLQFFRRARYGVSLTELMIAISIMAILSGATLTLLTGLSDDDVFQYSIDEMTNQLKLVKAKSVAGIVHGTSNKVFWGISTCSNSGNKNAYRIGYTNLDSNGNPTGGFNKVRDIKISEDGGVTFNSVHVCSTTVYFTRIQGFSTAVADVVLNLVRGTSSGTITITYPSGQIIRN